MYLHADDESLGQPQKTPNPDPKRHCPVLRDVQGRYVNWATYLNRTEDPKDAISKSLAALGQKRFDSDLDFYDYVAKCKQAQPITIPQPQPQPIPHELMEEIVKMLTHLRWQPKPKPKDPTIPTTLKMRK